MLKVKGAIVIDGVSEAVDVLCCSHPLGDKIDPNATQTLAGRVTADTPQGRIAALEPLI